VALLALDLLTQLGQGQVITFSHQMSHSVAGRLI
jgi:hypothetical protein